MKNRKESSIQEELEESNFNHSGEEMPEVCFQENQESLQKNISFRRGKRFSWRKFGKKIIWIILWGNMLFHIGEYIGETISFQFLEDSAYKVLSSKETRRKLQKIAGLIDLYYYNHPTAQEIEEGMYRGVMESLDDAYSGYYSQKEYQELLSGTSGLYYGIGVVLSQEKEQKNIVILKVYQESPAKEAGLQEGDILLSADGLKTDTDNLNEIVKQIKGNLGTTVSIVVERQGEVLEFQVERREVELPTVSHELLEEKTGYIQITEFSEKTPEQFQDAVTQLQQKEIKALIVDLRDNPGGVLTAVCKVLDQILPEGLLVYTEDKNGYREEYKSSKDTYLDLPLVVLVNENSASAAEIFAGAIKDYEYGTLVGTKTFGKGIVQNIIGLKDGSAVKMTTAKYFTPKGNDIHQVGIEPDILLEYEQLSDGVEYNLRRDNQVKKALELLGQH